MVRTRAAKESEKPVCQFCEKEIDEITISFRFGSPFIYLCPHCKKILYWK